MAERTLLDKLERYYDAVPRSAARAESIGPFTLFVREGSGFPYYARPTLGASQFTAKDVERVRERQRLLQLPEAFEWVAETTPTLREAVEASGITVGAHPLLVLDQLQAAPEPARITIRLLREDEPDLARVLAVGGIAFNAPGTEVGRESVEALEPAPEARVQQQRERLRRGLTVTAAAFDPDGNPIAIGSHQPVDGVSEIVGVGTLPAYRRRGIAAALTALLVQDAVSTAATVFLSAGDNAVARVYERVGFRHIGTACIAEA